MLVPRLVEDYPSRGIPQPLFLCADNESATVSVSAEGEVSVDKSSALKVLDTGAASFVTECRTKLPCFDVSARHDGFVVFKSRMAEQWKEQRLDSSEK